jgi:hypothetical protein
MSKLNKDVLFLIFEKLQDDSKSLFSCLMVNRLWCETAVPILWRNPWFYDINYSTKDYLFAIIISYLSDDILTSQGINLPSITQPLLFDYLSFCNTINVDIISTIITFEPYSVNYCPPLEREIYRVFMKKCSELKYLYMSSIEYQVFDFSEARPRFESLCELKCNASIVSSYFYELACVSQFIQKLIIYNDVRRKVYIEIVKLIEAQKNLKYFEWKDTFYGSHYTADPYKEILLALEKKSDTINHLILYSHGSDYTLRKVLPKFHKLKTLIINGFGFCNEEQLKMCVYHDLETFKIDLYHLKETSIIIENSGGHLRKILMDYHNIFGRFHYMYGQQLRHFNNEDSLILIRKIQVNCPSIEYLSLVFPPSEEHFIELEKLLKICQNLKSVLFGIYDYTSSYKEKILEYSEELLEILISSTPTKIKEIRFCGDFEFSLEALDKFFEKWEGCTLSILSSNYTYEGNNYKKLINKYKNNGIIKDFKCESYKNILNMDHILMY